jgi:UDP-N-acetylglucosamine--dolichyl-phosphate N-acetylglucosaminephosphotransferase
MNFIYNLANMVDSTFFLAGIILVITYIITLILTKVWIRAAKAFKLVGKDINKLGDVRVPEAGGVAVIFATVFGLFIYIFFKTFLLQSATHFVEILAIALTILLAGFLGFIDDILGWKKGLKQWHKPLLTLPLAIPLAVLNASATVMNVPFLGAIDFGIVYPLAIIPIAIVGAANGFNMLAGINGLEAGMGTIILGTLAIILYSRAPWLALIAAVTAAALFGFLLFNKYPARVFPGNSLTYAVGTLIGVLATIGDVTKAGLLLFTPYFIELILKARTKFRGESFGKPSEDGTLRPPEKISSLTHVSMRIFKTEKRAVIGILCSELVLAALALILFL